MAESRGVRRLVTALGEVDLSTVVRSGIGPENQTALSRNLEIDVRSLQAHLELLENLFFLRHLRPLASQHGQAHGQESATLYPRLRRVA